MNIENETGFPHFQFEKVGYYGELFTVVVVNQTFDFHIAAVFVWLRMSSDCHWWPTPGSANRKAAVLKQQPIWFAEKSGQMFY